MHLHVKGRDKEGERERERGKERERKWKRESKIDNRCQVINNGFKNSALLLSICFPDDSSN